MTGGRLAGRAAVLWQRPDWSVHARHWGEGSLKFPAGVRPDAHRRLPNSMSGPGEAGGGREGSGALLTL